MHYTFRYGTPHQVFSMPLYFHCALHRIEHGEVMHTINNFISHHHHHHHHHHPYRHDLGLEVRSVRRISCSFERCFRRAVSLISLSLSLWLYSPLDLGHLSVS
jgi:hypothetical protein